VTRRIVIALTVWLIATAGVAEEDLAAIEARLVDAVRSYDAAAATVVLSQLRSVGVDSGLQAVTPLRVRAGLAVAELLRIEFEETPEADRTERRTLGQRIDAIAQEALSLLSDVAESSESLRMRADLIATMIRSDFRARKYEDVFKAASSRALKLDDRNPRAWVTSAKPYLFAPPERGRDLEEAIRRLTRALELDPLLESARLLRAVAHETRGDVDAARADWKGALQSNPDCAPAVRALDRTGAGQVKLTPRRTQLDEHDG
jgi:tetratricopeptide (TPR) repeat protein